jgi:5'-deoxynucleotidase YfbR-like HD superfamily hydrolase
MAVAFLALYWSSFRGYPQEKRDRLVTLALVHDAHEAVIGDILPVFKTAEVRTAIETIQSDILAAFAIEEDETLQEELKMLDLISFLYEISQSSPRGMNTTKRELLEKIYQRQRQAIFTYIQETQIAPTDLTDFLDRMKL